ncbi:NUDIX hydrolase [Ureibacillus chungkukjangi]|uniref:Uncharacterized protein n=1 Tax=Ureibacillus chungkukjangi TaxID=1202712 RepID=A0A318TA07_9BACL|nr:hypothetical protein [Ureibacillus chungkukjangi]PYF01962.1 hypothetical protein BJ095_1514 [Ureibacillus chungkukjangi]
MAELLEKVQEPFEDDHYIKWLDIDRVQELLVHEHHFWAICKVRNKAD